MFWPKHTRKTVAQERRIVPDQPRPPEEEFVATTTGSPAVGDDDSALWMARRLSPLLDEDFSLLLFDGDDDKLVITRVTTLIKLASE
jgi:hypothetical protein